MKRRFRRAVRWVFLAALAIVLAYEEIQWRLAAVFALLGKLPVLHSIELWIASRPPYGALLLFALPSVFLFPLKLLALHWLAGGHAGLGITTIITAKVAGTAFVGRIFQLTKPALLTIGWCRWVFDRIMAVREAAYTIWRSFPVVRWWRARWARQKQKISWWKLKWLALREKFKKT